MHVLGYRASEVADGLAQHASTNVIVFVGVSFAFGIGLGISASSFFGLCLGIFGVQSLRTKEHPEKGTIPKPNTQAAKELWKSPHGQQPSEPSTMLAKI
jgi:hypothetical protein